MRTWSRQLGVAVVLVIVASAAPLAVVAQDAPAGPVQLRYDLRPGDRLVYKETLDRQVDSRELYGLRPPVPPRHSDPVESTVRAEWTVQLVVPAVRGGRIVAGFQRNRERAELARYVVAGRDALAAEQPAFAARLAGREVTAHATRVTAAGAPAEPPSVAREWPSKVLWAVTELAPLPAVPVKPGDRWDAPNPLGFSYQAGDWKTIAGERCLEVRGVATADLLIPRPDGARDLIRLAFWFCPGRGVVRRLELAADYPGSLFEKVTDHVVFELVDATRGEAPAAWLGRADARRGLLAAQLVDDSLPVDAAPLAALLGTGGDPLDRDVLALAWRRGLSIAAERLEPLLGSGDPRVRVLALRLLGAAAPERARPLAQRAAADSDPFVRAAAADVLRGARTGAGAPAPRASGAAAPAGASPPPSPRGGPGAAAVAPAPEGCAVDSAWTATQIEDQRKPSIPPGTVLRGMATDAWRGWPYAIRVPDDYRGDRPVPLLVYLAGNNGSALEALHSAGPALDGTGYLALYPNAADWWWHDSATAMVGALLNEVERTFAVDARRVYLTGLSNGGTGAFHFAARWPDRFAAAVEAMGAGVFQAGVDERDRPAPGNTATLPLLFLHGERDRTIAPETTRRTVAMLGPRRAPADTHFFPDRAHEITLGRGDDGLTLAFFTRQVRTAPPRYVRLETRDAAAARQYWVEVLEGESPSPAAAGSDEARRALAAMMRGPPMSVEGEIGPANEIRLTTKGVRRLRLLLRRDVLTAAGPVRVLLNGRERFAGPLPPDCAARARSLNRSPDPFQAYDAELELSPAGAR